MEKRLIDVSKHQGTINWEKVKEHIDGAIIRCGYGKDLAKQDDEKFKENAEACMKHGIPFGVYLYSYAKTVEDAKSEAAHVLRLLEPYKDKLSYPVYYDLEEAGTENGAVERAMVFSDIIEAAGYWCGIYANQYWWNTYLCDAKMERFTKWVARYSEVKANIWTNYDIWQYSSTGSVPGIRGNVDMNICYRDFPKEMKGNVTAVKKSDEEIATEVIAGKWGNGEERKNRLKEAGYNYDDIQSIVNAKCRETTAVTKKTNEEIAKEVIKGKWGNGKERKSKLENAGYDYDVIQKLVNKMM